MDIEHAVEVGLGQLLNPTLFLWHDAGIVDQHANGSEGSFDGSMHVFAGLAIGDIGADTDYANACLIRNSGCCPLRLVAVNIDDRHGMASHSECFRHGITNSRTCSRDGDRRLRLLFGHRTVLRLGVGRLDSHLVR